MTFQALLVSTDDEVAAVLEPVLSGFGLSLRACGHLEAIRELTLDDIDLPSRRITLAGHRQRLGDLTRDTLLAWLEYRRASLSLIHI